MKATKLSLSTLAVVMLGASGLPAGAVYNLYAKDGLNLDIHGEINVYAKNANTTTHIHYDDPDHAVQHFGMGRYEPVSDYQQKLSDRRTRLAQDPGASWIEFRAAQKMPNDWRVSGTVGVGYWDNSTGVYLNTANVVVDKKDKGALSLGRQYLHTAYVTRTNTYTPLETFGASSIRLDATPTDKLHLSAYYNTPSSADVREKNALQTKGFGVSASYLYPIGDSSVRVAGGYSNSQFNPDTTSRQGNNVPVESKAMAGSLEYRQGDFLLAADLGKKNEYLQGNVVNEANSNYMGGKIGYRLTPKLSLTAGYGVQDTKRTYQSDVKVSPALDVVPAIDEGYSNLIDAHSSFLFDHSKQKRVYTQADYYLKENVRLYARFDKESIQNKLEEKDFSTMADTTYRAGISLSF